MKEIKLTQGQVTQVDDEDYIYLNKYKWYAKKDKQTFYVARGIKKPNCKLVIVLMHREIMSPPCDMRVDHKDRNGLHNFRSNLRCCTNAENCRNSTLQSNSTSGYKGVSWSKKNKKWLAYIYVDYIHKHLGCFFNKNEAAIAYNNAAIKHFGKFASLNPIRED